MANEEFEHAYADGTFQYPNHPSMQRFLHQVDGPYSANPPIMDQKQPQFSGKNPEPVALGYYESPNPWPNNINTAQDPCPQESWSSGWTSLDQESCSGTTGNTWSPQATESCSDYDPRYTSWNPSQPLPIGYGYPAYSNGLEPGAGAISPHSYTGTLSEIQQRPDIDTEDSSMSGELHRSDRVYPAIAARLEPDTATFNRDEGLGSSVHGSASASPITEDDNMAMESIDGDGDNGSDYSPQGRSKRVLKSRKPRTNSRPQRSTSPTARRLSSAKSKPHQLTQPAKITKRSSSSKPSNIHTHSHTSPPAANPTHTIRCTYSQCSQTFPSTSTLSKHVLSAHTRPFTCSFRRYGCESTFGSKNEWKRHVSSIHLCLGIYRCDVGAFTAPHAGPRPRNNPLSFHSQSQHQGQGDCGYKSNRKDLFTQHLQRMHKPSASASRAEKEHFDNSLEGIRRRCWIALRDSPTKSMCGYCAPHPSRSTNLESNNKTKGVKPAYFHGPGSWDERMEHVGRHLEKGTAGTEVEDLELRNWMIEERLLEFVDGNYRVLGVGGKKRGRGASAVKEEGVVAEEDGMGEEDADGEDE
ncbi:MAG: hypothetical protein Q9166_001763 [cf. Caloplaca sp. 2 TL-2023]